MPRILDAIRDGPFLSSFLDRGRLRPHVEDVPVHVVTSGGVGLLGAASVAQRALVPDRA